MVWLEEDFDDVVWLEKDFDGEADVCLVEVCADGVEIYPVEGVVDIVVVVVDIVVVVVDVVAVVVDVVAVVVDVVCWCPVDVQNGTMKQVLMVALLDLVYLISIVSVCVDEFTMVALFAV